MNKLLLSSNNFYRTIDELAWFPRKIGIKIERSSSIIMFPTGGFAQLMLSKRYSGSCLRGLSKSFLTLKYKLGDSERIINLSTRSMHYQISIDS